LSSSIGLRQPIEALFGFNNIQLGYKQAKLSYELTLKQLNREELDLVYIVSQAFYGLLSAQEEMEIARMNLERQQEAYTIAQDKFKAGLIREVESLQMEVDLSAAVNNFDNTRVNFASQHNLFKETLGINLIDRPGSFGIGLTASIPILDWGENRARVRSSEAILKQNRLQLKGEKVSIEREIRGMVDQLHNNLSGLELMGKSKIY